MKIGICITLTLLNAHLGFSKFTNQVIDNNSDSDSDSYKEATQIALDSTGEFIPSHFLIKKIQSDLKLIRKLHPSMAKHHHQGTWKPGQLLIISRGVSASKLKEVEESEFKPVKVVRNVKNNSSIGVLLLFKKPYHPEHLSRLLNLRFGFNTKPVLQQENDEGKRTNRTRILYRHDLSTYFWNPSNGRNCLNGCSAQFSVSFGEKNEEENNVEFNEIV